ncbi:MAG: vacuolar family H+-ATPase subunit H [Butyrivibrio sp.]|nr:vacuolar family H+-ATPase subunit H [Butyrivibrio sp.]
MSKIEQIIGELEDYISSCKPLPLSNTKISVNKDELDEYIRELRLKTPDEIKKYQKLISNKDAILADARAQAEQMIHEAQAHTAELINEHEIMQRAIEQANEVIDDASAKAQAIVDRAQAEADEIRRSSILYTDNMLANLQMLMEHSIENTRSKYDTLINSMSKDLEIVTANRKELIPAPEEEESPEELAASVKEVMSSTTEGNFEI